MCISNSAPSSALVTRISGFPASLERNQSKRALAKSVRGGFSLRKKPLGMVLPGYSYSGFAVVISARSQGLNLQDLFFTFPRDRETAPGSGGGGFRYVGSPKNDLNFRLELERRRLADE
jgi:hypothetical protein